MTHSHQSARLAPVVQGDDSGRRSSDPICAACPPLYIADASPVLHCENCHAVIRDDEHYSISGHCEACLIREFSEAASVLIEDEALAEEMLDAVARQPVPRSTYFSLAIAFALLIVGMAWFAAVANWGAK